MPASKTMVAGCVIGAAAFGANAFVAPTVPRASLHGAVAQGKVADVEAPTLFSSGWAAVAGIAVLGSGVGVGKRSSRGSCIARNFNKETQIGAQEPLGFWDPLGFCEDEEKFKDFRAKEIKHGRLAMMGAVGMLAQSVVQVPGMEGVPKDVTACTVGNGQVGFIGTLAIIAALEAAVFVQDPNKEPGNFGNPLPWFDDYSDEMRARELNNGRIAMFSAIGIISASLYTGKPAIEQFNF